MTDISSNLIIQTNAAGLEDWMRGIEGVFSGEKLMLFMSGRMRPIMQRRARDRFAREGDEVSGDWLPLTEATNEIRQREGFPAEHPINQRTHGLFDWITRGHTTVIRGGVGWATMDWPGPQPNKNLFDKLQTAQIGKAKGDSSGLTGGAKKAGGRFGSTPARPVIGLDSRDAANAISSLSIFFIEQCETLRHLTTAGL